MKVRITIFAAVVFFLITGHTYADTLKTWADGTAYVKGKIIEQTSGCEVDGACSLILTINGQKVALVYAEGDNQCANLQPANWVAQWWGKNKIKGMVVQAFGAYTKQGESYSLRFCDSQDYFILGESDPLPKNKKLIEVR